MTEVVDQRKTTTKGVAGREKWIVEGTINEMKEALSGDQNALTGVKGYFPDSGWRSERGTRQLYAQSFQSESRTLTI